MQGDLKDIKSEKGEQANNLIQKYHEVKNAILGWHIYHDTENPLAHKHVGYT